jgi:hypothetical protein
LSGISFACVSSTTAIVSVRPVGVSLDSLITRDTRTRRLSLAIHSETAFLVPEHSEAVVESEKAWYDSLDRTRGLIIQLTEGTIK